MALSLANRSQFAFKGATYAATSVSVESPQPEIVNMTSAGDPKKTMNFVATGDYVSPGRIAVEAFGFVDPTTLVGQSGVATFTTRAGTFSGKAVCESAGVEGRVAEILRVRFSLLLTDYTE